MIEHLLAHKRSNLFAGMGLGKTSTSLMVADALNAWQPERTLVLAPKRVAASTWPREAKKWDNLKHIEVSPIIGDEFARKSALKRDASVYTLNYENLPWLVEHLADKPWPFKRVFGDESSRLRGFRLGGAKGRRARAIARHAHKDIEFWTNLSGTPRPNTLADLWGQMWFVDAGQRLRRTFGAFQTDFFEQKMRGDFVEYAPREGAEDKVRSLISDVSLSVRIEDWVDIAKPIVNKIYVDLPGKARVHYDSMEKELFAQVRDTPVEAFSAAARSGKCHQIAQGAVYKNVEYDENARALPQDFVEIHDAKLQALESIVEESDTPVLVSYNFKSDLARILAAFPQARELDEDPQTEDDWNAGKIPILVAHPGSAGHGLNLQEGGRTLVYFGIGWNLEYHEQILERIGPVRQMQSGLNRAVFVHYILARDTVDEDILERIEGKASAQQALMKGLSRRRG
jgi:SNF2 family DNA or RNA helicase